MPYLLVSKIASFRRYCISPHSINQLVDRCLPKKLSTHTANNEVETKLRIAIVGGGVSGLSLALHLAPLAERGLIATPIDLYEKTPLENVHPHESVGKTRNKAAKSENFHYGSGTIGRDIGVGVWSTALEPFLHLHYNPEKNKSQPRETHIDLMQKLMDLGHWVGNVGYRTPDGNWLTRNCLDTSGFKEKLSTVSSAQALSSIKLSGSINPGLLFLREKDFLAALRDAASCEQEKGIIQTFYAKSDSDGSTTVAEIIIPESRKRTMSGQLRFSDGSVSSTSTPYNLIVAADGMDSLLRSKYGGNESPVKQQHHFKDYQANSESTLNYREEKGHKVNTVENRQYTVFRGNSSLSDSEAGTNGESFQTWGEQKSMRFAVVGMSHPSSDSSDERVQKKVWFATTSVSAISDIEDAEERKRRIMKCFKNWHDPICDLINSTPADEILMERAVSHKHAVNPVFNLANAYQRENDIQRPGTGESGNKDIGLGPVLLFSGDANMTVDPVLAQGFTIAMETSADLARTLDNFLSLNNLNSAEFDIASFQNVISTRNEQRFGRILCLLRATDLVQALAQPHTGSISGFLSKNIVRPAINFTPTFIKKPAFASVMKYSLGLFGTFGITGTTKAKNTQP